MPPEEQGPARPVLPELPEPEAARGLGALSRKYLDGCREELSAWHEAGGSGTEVVAEMTGAVDRLVAFLFDAATASYKRRYVQLDQRCAVLAQGGYGRAELNPHSDIDLLFLFQRKVTPYVETITETILYSLWDSRLQVGHAVRSSRDCVRLAAGDVKIKTALVDTRYLCGDEPLSDEFFEVLDREILPKNAPKFIDDKTAELRARHEEFGGSVYLVEPQVKEGLGGLRDLHTALWLARIKYKACGLRDLFVKGIINERELAEVEQAREFLFKVRNAAHFLTRSHQDQLAFELQITIAENLGYQPDSAGDLKPVELFLRDYYRHAQAISRFSESMIDRTASMSRPYRLLQRFRTRTLRPGVQVVDGQLSVTDGDLFENDPKELVRVFNDAQVQGARFSSGLATMVREHSFRIDKEVREDPEIAEAFLSILRAPTRVYETVWDMHRLGVFEKLIPEWEHLRCLALHDHYHIYTVDQHSLMGIRELERLRDGETEDEAPLLTQVMRETPKPELLYLGMILHDSGKGLGGDHSERGAVFAKDIGARLGLNEDDTDELCALVRNHLVMSHLAQRRDINDDKLVRNFGRQVGTPDALRRLYLLTYADMRATGPKVWNGWKAMLLAEAYLRVQESFARGLEPEDRTERIERIRERVLELEAPSGLTRDDLAAFLDSVPPSYMLGTPELTMPEDAVLVRSAGGDGIATRLAHAPAFHFSELTVATVDRPGLFATITGVLASRGMNIVGARIATTAEGIAIDAFRVGHGDDGKVAMDGDRWDRTLALLRQVLAGEASLQDALEKAQNAPSYETPDGRVLGTEVVVENGSSDDFTVVDVYTKDRLGLLHEVATTLFDLGLEIHLAKITTNVDQVLDVFYVTEMGGGQTGRATEIRDRLLSVLREDGPESSDDPSGEGASLGV